MSPDASPFISYSANCEDVILHRLFRGRDTGFFVDVGAAHPVYENDTKALYDRGWRGINIEPNTAFYQELVAQRPEDCNINAAVSDSQDETIYHEVVGTGLSTCVPELADLAAARGFELIRHAVETVSLRDVLDTAAPHHIDLLKVDVEGFEMRVLSSNDWRRFRPKVILVEATYPESPHRRPDLVAPYLAGPGYRRVYFDGLNDYYLERDFEPPGDAFDRPPNVFDHFEPYRLHLANCGLQSAKSQVAALQDELGNAKGFIESLQHELNQAHHYIAGLAAGKQHAESYAATLQAETAKHVAAHAMLSKQFRRVKLRAEACAVDLENARAEAAAAHEIGRSLAVQLAHARTETAALNAQREHDGERLQLLQVTLDRVYRSTSWRVTRPLRAVRRPRRTLRMLLGGGPTPAGA